MFVPYHRIGAVMKYKFALSNLIISQIIILAFLSYAYFVWYTQSLIDLSGFKKLALVLISVNIVLGPLMVLIATRKKHQKQNLDLLGLLSIQVLALIFGAYSVYQQRPAYAVFTIDRFTLIKAHQAKPEKARYNEFKLSPLSGPKLAYALRPKDPIKRQQILMEHMYKGESDLDGRSEYYEPYSKFSVEIVNKGLDINEILKVKGSKKKLESFFDKYGGNKDLYAYLPLQTFENDVIWVLDKKNAEPIGILDIDPWQFSKPITGKAKKTKLKRRWLI